MRCLPNQDVMYFCGNPLWASSQNALTRLLNWETSVGQEAAPAVPRAPPLSGHPIPCPTKGRDPSNRTLSSYHHNTFIPSFLQPFDPSPFLLFALFFVASDFLSLVTITKRLYPVQFHLYSHPLVVINTACRYLTPPHPRLFRHNNHPKQPPKNAQQATFLSKLQPSLNKDPLD